MTAALRSEWLKLRTQRGTIVALATMCALMVGMTFFPSLDEPTQSLAFGFMFTVVAQAVGYIIVWLGWWARRRF